ncbi:Alpha/Beta hydrolase protein [Amylocarpus encephaloides]|uniref:Alpha/Beta hydrolase protein n=1 Tax=Amylocarpus encephaloides TaxID=45428 RepID=A0A9P8C2I0_9HELO|nr:Alpha/Beta hydrolase protein [Amylocarpus encephaloides]
MTHLALSPSLPTRVAYFLQVWGLKIVTILAFGLIRFFKAIPKELRPSIRKTYPCRPRLVNRVFIPQSHQPGERLPLYINLHAGGHVLLDAEFDDDFCAKFATRFNVLVASIEYSTAPISKFPGPTQDVVAIARAIIDDDTLPIDKSRVVIGGFSAGGNLNFSAAQMSELRGKIHGLVSFYPVTDFTIPPAEKHQSRPYRNAKDVDDLKDWGPIWEWAYVRPGQDLRDPLLSTRYAQKTDLPKWIYVVGAEYDMLANEARQMMFDLANLDKMEKADSLYGVEREGYKWTLVRDVRHGFTHNLMDNPTPEAVAMNRRRSNEVLEDLGRWLFEGPYAPVNNNTILC